MATNAWTMWAGWTQWLNDWRDVILDRTLDQLLGALAVGFGLSVLVAWVVVRVCRARPEALAPVAAVLMLGHVIAMSVGSVQIHRDLRAFTNLHREAIEHLALRDPEGRALRAGDRGRSHHPSERRGPGRALTRTAPDPTTSPTPRP